MPTLPSTDTPDALSQNLERPLIEVENCLNLLGEALVRRDAQAIESHAAALHQALAQAMSSFMEAARNGKVPPQLRNRLVQAGGRVAAQRESLNRSSAALDRAIDVLIPPEAGGVYGASGKSERKTSLGGSIQA